MLKVDRLKPYKFPYYVLGLILENEGTLEGTYSILKNIFSSNNREYRFQEGQLGYKESSFNNSELILINGDEKTVSIL